MQQLRLVGVNEDGTDVVLSAPDGSRYSLPLNDDLRAAIRRTRDRSGAPVALTPREVQALVRSGLDTDEVAQRSGWPVAKVEVFAAPVLAERAHVAGRAGEVRMRRPGDSSGGERLRARVERRLAARGVAAADVEWDAGRDEEGVWRVLVNFVAGGRERRAGWRYIPRDELVEAEDDEARWLSEDEDAAAVRPQPHRFGGGEQVFDVEARGGLEDPDDSGKEPAVTTVAAPEARVDQTDALMTAIRAKSHAGERRGRRTRRRGAAEPGQDALPAAAGDSGIASQSAGVDATPEPGPAPTLRGADEIPFADFEDAAAPGPLTPAPSGEPGPGQPAPEEVAPGESTPEKVAPEEAAPETVSPGPAQTPPPPGQQRPTSELPSDPATKPEPGPSPSETPAQSRPGRQPEASSAPEPGPGTGALPASDAIPPAARGTHPRDLAASPAAASDAVAPAGSTEPAPPSAPVPPAESEAAPPTAKPSRRKGRVGVPSWNDVMFGPSRSANEQD